MKKLPCINCITLGICRGIYHNYMNRNNHLKVWYKKSILYSKLTERCSVLKQYLKPTNKYSHNPRRNEFHDYMMQQEKTE